MKKVVSYLMVVLAAFVIALNYQIFVFPNRFAPAGLNGLFTMIQYLFEFKLSFASILLNVPLAIVVFFVVSKPFALRSLVYAVAFSAFLLLFETIDFSAFEYSTTVSKILGPAVGGLISGFCGYYVHRVGACLGGTEFIARLVYKKNPAFNLFSIIFALNVVVAVASYFVYGYEIEPVLLCIIYCYASSSVRDNMNQKYKSAVRCEIVTDQPKELGQQIVDRLHHSATVLTGTGLYTQKEKTVLVCVLNSSQVAELTKIVAAFPGSFVTVSQVSAVLGNFLRLDSHNHLEKPLYDTGKMK